MFLNILFIYFFYTFLIICFNILLSLVDWECNSVLHSEVQNDLTQWALR